MTVLDFPACRPLIELQAAAKLLLYSANNSAGKNKNEFSLYSSCCSCRMYWQKFAPICPTGARVRGGFSGVRFADECSSPSFSPNHPDKAVWLAASASEQGNPAEATWLLSHFSNPFSTLFSFTVALYYKALTPIMILAT